MTAAIYGQRAGKTTLMIEELSYGGQIINTPDIENYPGLMHVSGFDYSTKLYEQALELGAKFMFAQAVSVEDKGSFKIVRTSEGDIEAKSVILATGAKNRTLGMVSAELAGPESGLVGKGVSYCATCDGMFYRGKVTAIAGGGNTALDDALFLSNICSKVYVIHRRDEFRGSPVTAQKLAAKENVEFVLNSNVTGIIGEEKLTGVEVTNKLSGEKRIIETDGLFVAMGQVPDNSRYTNVVDIDDKGYIFAGETCTTKTPGIFAAGDCRTKEVRQLTTAASDGAVAALAAAAYIESLN